MGKFTISQHNTKLRLSVGTLCLAIAAVTQSWANQSVNEEEASATPSDPVEVDAKLENPIPATSTGWLTQLDDGQLRLQLAVPGGNLVSGDGIESIEDMDDHVTFTITPTQSEIYLQSLDRNGNYSRLHVRRMIATVHDLLPSPQSPEMMSAWLADDDIHTAMRFFMIYLNSHKNGSTPSQAERDFMVRDFLLQASHSVIMRDINGDLRITLYRKNWDDGSLIHMGEVNVDPNLHYQLKGKISDATYQEWWKTTITELMMLQKSINEMRLTLKEQNGVNQSDANLKEELQALEKQFNERYKDVGMAYELNWYGITETIDYGANSWLKMADASNSGIHAAAVGSNYKVMSALVELEAAKDIQREGLRDLLVYVRTLLEDTRKRRGLMPNESINTFLTRQLATVWTALNARLTGAQANSGYPSSSYALPAQYLEKNANYNPYTASVVRINDTSHFVTSGRTLQQTLDQMAEVLPEQTNKLRPDKVIVSEHQFRQMKEVLNRSGWMAWLKSFVNPDAYHASTEADQLRTLLAQNNRANLSDLVATGMEGGAPVRIIDPANQINEIVFVNQRVLPEYQKAAEREFSKEQPQLLVIKETESGRVFTSERVGRSRSRQIDVARLESETKKMDQLVEARANPHLPDQHSGMLRKIADQTLSTLTAAGTGMATGYFVQRGVDAASKYHNEGIAPWRLSNKELEAQHERAIKTGTVMAANAAVSHLTLPYVAERSGYFSGLSGIALRNQALKSRFEASIAGGIAGTITQSSMAGYQYWQGNLSAGELAVNVADATGRGLFTTLGSMSGHALAPYSFDVPYVSNLLPIGNVGAVLGSFAGNVAYDTVKHYIKGGVQQVSEFYYDYYGSNDGAVVNLSDTSDSSKTDSAPIDIPNGSETSGSIQSGAE